MRYESKDARSIHSDRAFSYQLVASYHNNFIDPTTGNFYEHLIRYRDCPVCSSSNLRELFKVSGGYYVTCCQCKMIFTNPVFTDSALEKYYRGLVSGQGQIVEQESDFYKEIFSNGLDDISCYVGAGEILDVGCSIGFLLDIARAKGWKTFGAELGEYEAQIASSKGHTIYKTSIENIPVCRKFDCICLYDVFEHMPNPKKELSSMRNHLKDGGVVFMQIPNSGSLASRVLQEKCKMFDGLEHVSLYNPQTITKLLFDEGFSVLSIKTVISEIAVMNSYLSYDNPYFGSSDFCGDLLLNCFDSRLIHENMLGYKIQIIFKIDSSVTGIS